MNERVMVHLGGLLWPTILMDKTAETESTSIFRCGPLQLLWPSDEVSEGHVYMNHGDVQRFFDLNRIAVAFSDGVQHEAVLVAVENGLDVGIKLLDRSHRERRFRMSPDKFQRDMENGCLDLSDIDDVCAASYNDSKRIGLAQRLYDELVNKRMNRVDTGRRHGQNFYGHHEYKEPTLSIAWRNSADSPKGSYKLITYAVVTDVRCPPGKPYTIVSLEERDTEVQFQLLLSIDQLQSMVELVQGEEFFVGGLDIYDPIPAQLRNTTVLRWRRPVHLLRPTDHAFVWADASG